MRWSVEINPVLKKGNGRILLIQLVLLENRGNCIGHRRERGEGTQSTELEKSATFY